MPSQAEKDLSRGKLKLGQKAQQHHQYSGNSLYTRMNPQCLKSWSADQGSWKERFPSQLPPFIAKVWRKDAAFIILDIIVHQANETLLAPVPEADQKILPVHADIEDRNGAGKEPIQPSSPPASPAPPRKRQRMGTVNAPITLSSDVQSEDHTEPERRADDYVKVVCASKLYNDMPFRQKVNKDTYIFLRQMRPDLVPWTASIWDTNAARDGTILDGCMFAQVDPAKAYKLEKLVKSAG